MSYININDIYKSKYRMTKTRKRQKNKTKQKTKQHKNTSLKLFVADAIK